MRHRATVYGRWGFARPDGRGLGITALFAGPSGTGKTLAAEVVAGALRLDLCHIDLSVVVSKYIGETEKNLRQVFDAAEAGGAVLFFDEADALYDTQLTPEERIQIVIDLRDLRHPDAQQRLARVCRIVELERR